MLHLRLVSAVERHAADVPRREIRVARCGHHRVDDRHVADVPPREPRRPLADGEHGAGARSERLAELPHHGRPESRHRENRDIARHRGSCAFEGDAMVGHALLDEHEHLVLARLPQPEVDPDGAVAAGGVADVLHRYPSFGARCNGQGVVARDAGEPVPALVVGGGRHGADDAWTGEREGHALHRNSLFIRHPPGDHTDPLREGGHGRRDEHHSDCKYAVQVSAHSPPPRKRLTMMGAVWDRVCARFFVRVKRFLNQYAIIRTDARGCGCYESSVDQFSTARKAPAGRTDREAAPGRVERVRRRRRCGRRRRGIGPARGWAGTSPCRRRPRSGG